MDIITGLLAAIGFDMASFIKLAAVFTIGSLAIGLLGRGMFGRKSHLNHAVSSSIGILFMYVLTVVIIGFGGELERFRPLLSPLPFVDITDDALSVFVIEGAAYQEICAQLLRMVILAFLVNLIDSFLPRGKNIIVWFLMRFASVILSMAGQLLVTTLLNRFLPDVIVMYAPGILVALLVIMLAVGALKILVGAAIATINPIIGALYTFFFANIIGKQLSKAVLSTALLACLVWVMNEMDIVYVAISGEALSAYIPFLGVIVVIWYILNQIL